MVEKMDKYKHDVLVAEEVLLGAEAISKDAGLPLTTFAGQPAVRWDQAEMPKLAFAPRADWGDYDQIVLRAAVEPGVGCEVSVRIEMNTHTEGLEKNDSYWAITAVGNRRREWREGWQELRFGIEGFLIHGNPSGWRDVRELFLGLFYGGPLFLKEVVLQKRARVEGPRLTDAGLFAELDLTLPSLEAVRAAVEAGDLRMAVKALREHYQHRERPIHKYHRPPDGPPPLGAADAICGNFIFGRDRSARVDWRARANDDLQRHYFMTDLIHACQVTRQARYAQKLDELLGTWIAAQPVPLGDSLATAWSTLSAACRFKRTWLEAFFSLVGEPAFRDETFLAMLKSMYEHAEFLLRNSTLHATNWLVIESQALALIGVMFPEFRNARRWQEEGFARLSGEIQRQVYPDGTHHELSGTYHISSAAAFTKPFELARLNQIPIPLEYEQRLRAMYDFIWRISRPDFTIPPHNDSGGGEHTYFLRKGHELFGDPVLQWFGSNRTAGTPPTERSLALRNAGFLIMRTGWDKLDKYLFFDGGPFGAGHQHEDKLGLDVYAYGASFLRDPGIPNYREDRWFSFYRSTAAHNTVLIDGNGQQRSKEEYRPLRAKEVSGENFWASGQGLDVARSQYEQGYANGADKIIHRRTVVFVKPDYWLVIDELDGAGSHIAEFLWHFAPMRVERDGLRVRSNRGAVGNLEIVPLLGGDLGLRILCGEQDPVQGWVAEGVNDVPAPCAIYQQTAPLPIRQVWALVPYPTGTSAGLKVRSLSDQRDASAFELTFQDGATDAFCFRWSQPGQTNSGPLSTDGKLALIRRGASGQLQYAAVVLGTRLSTGGESLLHNPQAGDLLERFFSSDSVK